MELGFCCPAERVESPPRMAYRASSTVETVLDPHLPPRAPSPRPALPAVHPGWLSAERPGENQDASLLLDDEIRFNALSQLLRTAGALDRAATGILAGLGLTAGAFFALLELSDAGATGLAPSELSRRLSVARRTATLYVDILTRQGWVSRTPHPGDRRMVVARLTTDGEWLVAGVARAYQSQLASLLADLSPNLAKRLTQMLEALPVVQPPASQAGDA